jgi:hypothetical protein
MIPAGFKALKWLRGINVFAVGAALAGLTGSVFAATKFLHSDAAVITSTATTFLIGVLWAITLRSQRRVTRWKLHAGWLLSPIFAMLNASLAVGWLMTADVGGHSETTIMRFGAGMLVGATFGSIVWIPALIATLLCFGLPLHRAQELAARGLGGEERGEKIVGITAAILGMMAILIGGPSSRISIDTWVLLMAMGGAAVTAGGTTLFLAHARAKRREAFVKQVEAGQIEGYRVESIPEGKVLIRVETGNEVYRAGERFEAVYELGVDGEARRALTADGGD